MNTVANTGGRADYITDARTSAQCLFYSDSQDDMNDATIETLDRNQREIADFRAIEKTCYPPEQMLLIALVQDKMSLPSLEPVLRFHPSERDAV